MYHALSVLTISSCLLKDGFVLPSAITSHRHKPSCHGHRRHLPHHHEGRCAPFTKMKVSFFMGLVLLALNIIGQGAELSGTRSHTTRRLSSTPAIIMELGVGTSGINMIQKGNSVKPVTWPPFSRRKSVASPRWKGEQSRSKRSALTLDQQQDVNVADIALTYSLDLGTARSIFRAADGDRNGSLNGQEVIAFFGLIDGALASKRVMMPRK